MDYNILGSILEPSIYGNHPEAPSVMELLTPSQKPTQAPKAQMTLAPHPKP